MKIKMKKHAPFYLLALIACLFTGSCNQSSQMEKPSVGVTKVPAKVPLDGSELVLEANPPEIMNILYSRGLKRDEVEVAVSTDGTNMFYGISVWGIKADSLSFLRDLQFRYLGVEFSEISDISELRNHPEIEILSFKATSISDIKALSALKNLSMLDLSWTEVTDLSPLANLPHLEKVMLWGTKVLSIEPILTKSLRSLDVDLNCVSDEEFERLCARPDIQMGGAGWFFKTDENGETYCIQIREKRRSMPSTKSDDHE